MKKNLLDILDTYAYDFPPSAIAQKPAKPRDSAKLLVYTRRTDTTAFDIFRNIGTYLPPKSVIVLNDTKVLPARLRLQTESGVKLHILYLRTNDDTIHVLASRKLQKGSELYLNQKPLFSVLDQKGKEYVLQPTFPIEELVAILTTYGEMPLPPYIKYTPLSRQQLNEEYQTVFAKKEGSIAAPTASLHFTPKLLKELQAAGHQLVYITLHVNLGTFAPLTEENMQTGLLHEEWYSISVEVTEALMKAKQEGRSIIGVGTTVVRTLESAALSATTLKAGTSTTRLFIQPGYSFQWVDGIISNFHVPRSSLLMLMAAFTGREKILELYKDAIKNDFRLFSFGDAMLIT